MAQLNTTLIPGMYAKGIETYRQAPHTRLILSKPLKSKKRQETMQQDPDLGLIPSKPIGSPMQPLQRFEGPLGTFDNTPYAAYLTFEREDKDDDLYGTLNAFAKRLPASANATMEDTFWTMILGGFATYKTADGAYIFSASHYHRVGGTAYSNLASASALSLDSLWDALNAFRNTTDGGGKRVIQIPKYLVHGPALDRMADELLGSTHVPNSDANAINAVRKFKLQSLSVPWITGYQWFIWGGDHEVYNWMRNPIELSHDGDFFTDASHHGVYFRHGCKVYSGMGIYGNAGAAA